MRKFLILGAAVAALGLFAFAPADAATRNAAGVANAQAAQMDLSARRYYRGHYHYYYRRYHGPYYYRRYYGPRYYYPYPYYYGPRYYYPYGYPYYYRRPGIYFGFGW
jgi:hypothetical protein